MATHIIELSEAAEKALAYVAPDPQAWIENVVRERCRIASDEIVMLEVQRKIDAGEPIRGTKDELVLAAPIKSAAERMATFQAEQQVFAESLAATQATVA